MASKDKSAEKGNGSVTVDPTAAPGSENAPKAKGKQGKKSAPIQYFTLPETLPDGLEFASFETREYPKDENGERIKDSEPKITVHEILLPNSPAGIVNYQKMLNEAVNEKAGNRFVLDAMRAAIVNGAGSLFNGGKVDASKMRSLIVPAKKARVISKAKKVGKAAENLVQDVSLTREQKLAAFAAMLDA